MTSLSMTSFGGFNLFHWWWILVLFQDYLMLWMLHGIFLWFFFSIIQCIDHCLKLKKKSIYFHEFIIYNFYRQIELIVKKYKKDYYLGLFAVLRNPPPHLKTSRKFMVTFKLSILDQIGENHCILRGKNSILLFFLQ